jgi:hypothetical protein
VVTEIGGGAEPDEISAERFAEWFGQQWAGRAPSTWNVALANRRARVRRKGGAIDVIVWQTGTARLLPRLVEGRQTGPLFVTERKARVQLPAADHSCRAISRTRPAAAWPRRRRGRASRRIFPGQGHYQR